MTLMHSSHTLPHFSLQTPFLRDEAHYLGMVGRGREVDSIPVPIVCRAERKHIQLCRMKNVLEKKQPRREVNAYEFIQLVLVSEKNYN